MLWLVCLQGVGQLRLQKKETRSLTYKKCNCLFPASCVWRQQESNRHAPICTSVSVGNMQTLCTAARHCTLCTLGQNRSDVCLQAHKDVSRKGPSGGSDKKTRSGVRCCKWTDSEEEKSLDIMVDEYSQDHEKQAKSQTTLPAQTLLETKGEMFDLKFPTRCRGLWRADQLLLINSFRLKKHQFWLDKMRTWGVWSKSG